MERTERTCYPDTIPFQFVARQASYLRWSDRISCRDETAKREQSAGGDRNKVIRRAVFMKTYGPVRGDYGLARPMPCRETSSGMRPGHGVAGRGAPPLGIVTAGQEAIMPTMECGPYMPIIDSIGGNTSDKTCPLGLRIICRY